LIAIIDYGMGNLRSVQKGFEKVGYSAVVTSSKDEVASASGVILPGVGAFPDAMECLRKTGMDEVVREVAGTGKPLLGVCLGLQLLFSWSEETFGKSDRVDGLDIIQGRVVRFRGDIQGMKIPQMGWNTAHQTSNNELFNGIPDGSFFYFVHSYYVVPDNPEVVSTWTDYGVRFASSVRMKNIYAAQFHPEKSSSYGLELFRNFGRIVEKCC
jgi:glutamine amidotransferase